MVSNCEFVTFSLVSHWWGTLLYRFLIFAPLLILNLVVLHISKLFWHTFTGSYIFVNLLDTRDVFYVRREVDLMKTAKVNAYIMHIFGKIELLSLHATLNYFKIHYFNAF